MTGKNQASLNAYRVTIDHLIVDPAAVMSYMGTAGIVGGSFAIATAMAPDTKLLKCFGSVSAVVCFDCALKHSALEISERMSEREKDSHVA